MGLRENAAAAAGRAPAADEPPTSSYDPGPYEEPDVPEADLTGDPDKVDAITAWLRVMGDVRVVRKAQRFDGGRAGKFNFRGVDAVYNAFGPICRRHGVAVFPVKTTAEYRDIATSSGGKMRECTATVTYRVYGPSGDFIETQTMGEATDTGSRSTPKAQSVALRTLMLTGGMVPTEDRDPDADPVERGHEAPARPAESYRDEILNPKTSPGRLQQIGYELTNLRMLGRKVQNETGEWETLDDLGRRIYAERTGGGA
ncbi:ERF family protein [Streptomyces sp. NPDC049577]|uniref:ERF family protein n=1 Tax=Streptomyces sp. NPDC049577 TaxID=3155153 RepID=UPI003430934F